MLRVSVLCLLLLSVCHTGEGGVVKPEESQVKNKPTELNVDVRATPPVAISAARTTNHTRVGRVRFPETVVNNGLGWNPAQSILTVPYKSVYFFHVNAGALNQQKINLSIRGLPTLVKAERDSTTHNGRDSISRDFIASLETGVKVYVDNSINSSLYSQGGRHTSFTAFDIKGHLAASPVIFSAARDTSYTSVGDVDFNNVFVNDGGAFDLESQSRVNIVRSGIYFFSLSVGVPTRLNVRAQIVAQSDLINPIAEVWRSSDMHNGPDVMNIAAMAQLEEGDAVSIHLRDGEIFSDDGLPTYFGGFLYEPSHGHAVAWSVYGRSKHAAADRAVDPLPFDGVTVNTDGIFSLTDNRVHIPRSGVYYVNLNIGAQANNPIDASVMLDRQRVEMNVYRTSTTHFGEDTLNQGLVLRLSAGNTLRVALGPNSRSYSDGDRQTIFMGFLLSPDD